MESTSQQEVASNNGPVPQARGLWNLTARMVLAVLVSPWFGVGFLYGLAHVFRSSLFLGGNGPGGWQQVIMLSLMAVGPTAISLSLSPNWRGLLAAVLASFALILGFLPAGEIFTEVMRLLFPLDIPLGILLPSALGAAIPIVIALPITGYVARREGYAGLFVGISLGVLLVLIYEIVAPWLIVEHEELALLGTWNPTSWAIPFAFVWSSSIFFPELLRRRVGWAGLLIWAGLQASIFGVGVYLNQFWIG